MRKLDKYEAKVRFQLYRQGFFGADHRLIETVTSGFPSHELDKVKHAIQALIKDGILVKHPTKHGEAVHLDANKRLDLYETLRSMPDYRWLPK